MGGHPQEELAHSARDRRAIDRLLHWENAPVWKHKLDILNTKAMNKMNKRRDKLQWMTEYRENEKVRDSDAICDSK